MCSCSWVLLPEKKYKICNFDALVTLTWSGLVMITVCMMAYGETWLSSVCTQPHVFMNKTKIKIKPLIIYWSDQDHLTGVCLIWQERGSTCQGKQKCRVTSPFGEIKSRSTVTITLYYHNSRFITLTGCTTKDRLADDRHFLTFQPEKYVLHITYAIKAQFHSVHNDSIGRLYKVSF